MGWGRRVPVGPALGLPLPPGPPCDPGSWPWPGHCQSSRWAAEWLQDRPGSWASSAGPFWSHTDPPTLSTLGGKYGWQCQAQHQLTKPLSPLQALHRRNLSAESLPGL